MAEPVSSAERDGAAYESLEAEAAAATGMGVIATTVLISVLAHGVTASPSVGQVGSGT